MPVEYDDEDDDDGSSFSTGSELERDRYRQQQQHHQHRGQMKRVAVAGAGAQQQYADENENPDTLQSLGYGDAGLGFNVNNNNADKDRFLDLQPVRSAQHKRTRVDDYSDATPSGETSSSDEEFSLRLGMRKQPNATARPVTASTPHPRTTAGNRTAAVDSTVGAVSYSNVSKSAFDGMARELRKEFERIMDMSPARPQSNHTQKNTLMAQQPVSPRMTAGIRPKTAQKTKTLPSAKKRVTVMPAASDTSPDKRQRTFGQALPIYGQPSSAKRPTQSAQFKPAVPPSVSPFRAAVNNVRSQHPTQASAYLSGDDMRTTRDPRSQGYDRGDQYCNELQLPDVTGVTDAITSPSRVTSGPSTHRGLPSSRFGSQISHHAQEGKAQ